MPGGSDYRGPAAALAAYAAAVQRSQSRVEVKGARNPHTSRNGHMFSFLADDGTMALRLSDALAQAFQARYDSGPVMQYGRVMRGYVSVPAELLSRTDELAEWFDRSHEWIGSLEPKATRKAARKA